MTSQQQQKAKIVMRERERVVRLKTKNPICNMIFFEIRFEIRVYMFAQVFEARVNPYHPSTGCLL
jgi:hypothetical protein